MSPRKKMSPKKSPELLKEDTVGMDSCLFEESVNLSEEEGHIYESNKNLIPEEQFYQDQ